MKNKFLIPALFALACLGVFMGLQAFKNEGAVEKPTGVNSDYTTSEGVEVDANGVEFADFGPGPVAAAKGGKVKAVVGPTANYYAYQWTKDTISNALNDTLYLPSSQRPLFSDWQCALSIKRTNISGTTNVAVKVEETTYLYSGSTPPTDGWVATTGGTGSAIATAATTATQEELLIPHTYGTNYRIIVDGTGTQSTSYVLRWVMKKKV